METRTGDGSVTVEVPRAACEVPRAACEVSARTGDGGAEVPVRRGAHSAQVLTARTGEGKLTARTAN